MKHVYAGRTGWVVAVPGLMLGWALGAEACVNTGTPLEPCHCLEHMAMMSVTTPGLSGLARPALGSVLPAASQVYSATVGDIYYDYNGNMTGDVTINAGDTVHWTNTGFAGHTVSAVPGQADFFDSGIMFNNDTFSHTFDTPGTYTYYCEVHSFAAGGQAFGPQVGHVTVLAVPEPGAVAGIAVVGLLARVARRRRWARTG